MYAYHRFESYEFPKFDRTHGMDTPPLRDGLVSTAAGAFDHYGQGRTPYRFPAQLDLELTVMAASAAIRTEVDRWRGLAGTRGRLYRIADSDDEQQWCTARFVQLEQRRGYENNLHQKLVYRFQQLDHWRGESHGVGWFFDAGEIFDDPALEFDEVPPTIITPGGITLTINNGGNIPTSNVAVTVTAGSADISIVAIAIDNGTLSWTGSLPSGESLIIDGGAHSVTVSGDNAYSGFELDSTHSRAGWFVLDPGDNSWDIAIEGGSTDSTISVVFYDAWA